MISCRLQRAKEDLGRKPVALTASDADEFCYFLNPLPWPKRYRARFVLGARSFMPLPAFAPLVVEALSVW